MQLHGAFGEVSATLSLSRYIYIYMYKLCVYLISGSGIRGPFYILLVVPPRTTVVEQAYAKTQPSIPNASNQGATGEYLKAA